MVIFWNYDLGIYQQIDKIFPNRNLNQIYNDETKLLEDNIESFEFELKI